MVELTRNGVYLTFPRDALVCAGDTFRLLYPVQLPGALRQWCRHPNRIAAIVEVTAIDAGARAKVDVLYGSVARGVWAEKLIG